MRTAPTRGIDERCSRDHARRQRDRNADEGLSYVVQNGKKAFTLVDAVAWRGQPDSEGVWDGTPWPSIPISRQPRADPHHHAPDDEQRRRSASRANRVILLSAATEITWQ